MNHHALMVLCVALCTSGCGKSDVEPRSENPTATVATKVVSEKPRASRQISTLTLSESAIFVDDVEIKAGDGLEALASVLGQPDRKAGDEGEESWTWDGLGITAKGSQAKIRSLYVKFGDISARTGARSQYSGVVIVNGSSPGEEVRVDADSDAEELTAAQRIHHGFSATSDSDSGRLLDIGVEFLSAERLQTLDQSPLLHKNQQPEVSEKR